jgi:cytochrome c2
MNAPHRASDTTKMTAGFRGNWRVQTLGALMIVIWLGPINQAKAADTGQQIFQSKCAACHTIGKGNLVGPDLAGVTVRREENWLKRQIKEPDRLIAENDPIALQLLQQANNVPMVPLGLSDAEVAAVIAYLKSTEQQADVATGLPSQYMPTMLVSALVLISFTLIALRAGKKEVDVN